MLNWLREWLSLDNRELEEVYDICEQHESDIRELRSKVEVLRAEMWEYVDGSIRPLSKRIKQRLNRDEKDINTTIPSGIIRPSGGKLHGTSE